MIDKLRLAFHAGLSAIAFAFVLWFGGPTGGYVVENCDWTGPCKTSYIPLHITASTIGNAVLILGIYIVITGLIWFVDWEDE